MKKFVNLALSLVVAVSLFSCRDEHPEDTHEHEEISKVVVSVTKVSDGTTQTINYIDGVSSQNLILENGETYITSLDFQSKHDDHYHSVNDEIIEEKDEHFITFAFAGVDVNLTRESNNDVRSDGSFVGLKSRWTVTSAPASTSRVEIKLYHTPTSVIQNSPSSVQQFGTASGGEVDVDMQLTIN